MRVIIIGAGGHAQVVADILLRAQEQGSPARPIGYLDDDPLLVGQILVGLPVMGTLASLPERLHDAVIVAIGDNRTRHHLFQKLAAQGEQFVAACHPRSVIAPDVPVGTGSMICAGAVVNPGSVIGADIILNTGCTVDHHNQVGDHAHVGPGAHLGGEVVIGVGVLVGIGATIMPRQRVGNWSTIGAGACVTKSVSAGLTVVGVPAKPLQRN